ncbi:serine/threonine protein kinase [Saprolegnia parasitica CBS 223.65]|uniref:Serine/threonine protein kinase n=1 Tax=Saprolegnia parasitica (strain CBS 223.65) TaxID=695850 RepID=A0A067CR71_SAPPC|nr:serine/threonine protein kinase [Saprolegnia parasitica CBS 223.65]KDO31720.1 serine/threonine protein kinase [Saprolegnia parasitica CBS 223.65]|eukprot:XP_012197603.1 serine/threonine protein kinase [Saprolegnia parasitica CBS 223.65]
MVLVDLFPHLFRDEYPRELGCYPRPFNEGGTLLDYDDFEDYAPIATGKATTVFKATHCSSGTVVAIKAIVRASMTYGACVNFRRAVEFGFHIQDPAVVPVFGWFYTNDKVFIVMEYCVKGDLHTVYPAPDPVAPWEVANVARQLVQGLKTIHGNGVAHRRLTLDNILVTEDGTVKIANFGGAARGKRVDVWSLGIVLFTLLSGATPVTDGDGDTLLPLQFPDDMSVDGIDLITQILVDDETKRLSLSAIEAHAFLATDN